MAAAAKERSATFTWENAVTSFEALLESTIAKRQ
jgi:hypothetical protein